MVDVTYLGLFVVPFSLTRVQSHLWEINDGCCLFVYVNAINPKSIGSHTTTKSWNKTKKIWEWIFVCALWHRRFCPRHLRTTAFLEPSSCGHRSPRDSKITGKHTLYICRRTWSVYCTYKSTDYFVGLLGHVPAVIVPRGSRKWRGKTHVAYLSLPPTNNLLDMSYRYLVFASSVALVPASRIRCTVKVTCSVILRRSSRSELLRLLCVEAMRCNQKKNQIDVLRQWAFWLWRLTVKTVKYPLLSFLLNHTFHLDKNDAFEWQQQQQQQQGQ